MDTKIMQIEINIIKKLFCEILNSNDLEEKWQKINYLIEVIDSIDETGNSNLDEYISDIIYKLSFYEPDIISREECDQYFGDDKLKDIFEEFKERMRK